METVNDPIEQIEEREDLPWGLHDSRTLQLHLDWPNRTARFLMDIPVSERQETFRRAELLIEGLVYVAVDPPVIDEKRSYEPAPSAGLWTLPYRPAGPPATHPRSARSLTHLSHDS